MEYVFWTQNEKSVSRDTLIIDGEKSEFDSLPIQNEAMSMLKIGKAYNLCKVDDYVLNRSVSKNLEIRIKRKKGVAIQGMFHEIDEHGRNMPFFLWCNYDNYDNYDKVISLLKECSLMVGKTAFDDDAKIIKEVLEDQKSFFKGKLNLNFLKKKVIRYSVFLIVLIVLIWILCY